MDMKKIVIHKAGSYDQLKIEEVSELHPGNNQVVVQVHAIGVNYADCLVRWGVYESAKKYVGWPITPGFEFTGVIKKVGPGCRNLQVGQEVMGVTLFNAYATEVCVSEKQIFSLPQGFSKTEAAGFPAVFFTAYHALFQIVRLYPRAHILVHSAAGGVGSALTQLAHGAGFDVTGVVGSSHKVEAVKGLGADFVIDKSQEDLWKKVEELCPEGYDAIFDANGFVTLKEGYRHLRPTGKLISYGAHSLLPKGGAGRLNYFKAAWGLLRTPRFNPLQLITDNKSVGN
ncbi:zinc-binding dehydrogenase [Bdellovibrio sp. HCB2-146]|uniref:zinc-binding dehydrogenase n=1 Tax=Bdellovibrio sp. HCB2-146 TaxID=3394362 RepID=UPI0039BD7A8F